MTKLNLIAEPGSHALSMWREFNAPRDLVFKAMTDPALIPQWWGPHGVTTTVDRMEVKKGGVWRYVQSGADGEYAFSGVYHEITVPERIVNTFEFEGLPGHVLLETVMFEDHGGKTIVRASSIYQSVEDRDGMIASGMEGGAEASWDRFEDVLKTL